MTQSPPDPSSDSRGEPESSSSVILHLSCPCQRPHAAPLSLCGYELDLTHPAARRDVPVRLSSVPVEVGCVVCVDLARVAVDAGRCERCPT